MTGVALDAPRVLRTERRVWALGLTALGGTVLLAAAVVVVIAVAAPPGLALLVPAVLALAGALAIGVQRHWHPALPTLALVGAYAPLSGHSAGLQVGEVVFAVAYAVFLVGWFGSRVFVYRERIVRSGTDVALAVFLGYAALSPLVGMLHGARPGDLLADMINISFLSLYFPLREVGARYHNGLTLLSGLVVLYGIVSVFRVVTTLNAAFSDAEYAWQIARGRVTMGELFMYQGALLCLALAAVGRRWGQRLLCIAGFSVFTVGLLLTQWRSYYVALALGIVVLGALLRGRERIHMAGLFVLGALVAAAFAYAAFGDTVLLIGYGLLDRALSLGTATQTDISLINRGFESRRAMQLIVRSPVLGYGPGVSFGFLDAISHRTWVKPYAHNAYLSMAFKYGIIGTIPFLIFWISHTISSVRQTFRDTPVRIYACFAAASLIPLFASHLVSAAFNTGDTVLAYTFVFAFAGALAERAAASEPY